METIVICPNCRKPATHAVEEFEVAAKRYVHDRNGYQLSCLVNNSDHKSLDSGANVGITDDRQTG